MFPSMHQQQESVSTLRPPSKPTKERRKLVLLTEIISPYRIPVFNALALRGDIDLHVIFLAETDPTQRHWLVYKEEIRFPYEVLPSWRRRLGGYHVLINRRLGSALRRADPDVIVCGGYNYLASWRSLGWARQHRVPFVIWVESTSADQRNRRPLIEFVKHKFMGNCDAFIVAGKSAAEYVRSLGAGQQVIFTAPDAVDTQFFSDRSTLARQDADQYRRRLGVPRRFFISVGRLVRQKGVFDLLHAYGSLPASLRSEVGLVFVGEGPSRQELEQQASSISPGLIQFPGFIQREELPSYYGLAETFVFPTHSDPWGLVVNEAMACSLPIVCSREAGCAADLVDDGWNGRIVSAHDAEALTSAMVQLAGESNLRARMGTNSWQRIQMYSPQACAAGIAEAARFCGLVRYD